MSWIDQKMCVSANLLTLSLMTHKDHTVLQVFSNWHQSKIGYGCVGLKHKCCLHMFVKSINLKLAKAQIFLPEFNEGILWDLLTKVGLILRADFLDFLFAQPLKLRNWHFLMLIKSGSSLISKCGMLRNWHWIFKKIPKPALKSPFLQWHFLRVTYFNFEK